MSGILEIKEAVEKDILSLPGVSGIGIGKSSAEKINVYVKRACPTVLANIPAKIGGVDVRVIETGTIFALQLLQAQEINRMSRVRPYPGGVSIGHMAVTAGTLGSRVYDVATGEKLLLSNNHIFANTDSKSYTRATIGDTILQPGSYDGGQNPQDKVAELERWIKIDDDSDFLPYTGDNIVDAAVARPISIADVNDEIIGIGVVTEMASASIGQTVRKSGRTTGLMSGSVVDTNATIKVEYGILQATFRDQLIITPAIGAGGDSGSLVVDDSNKAVGLLFAGSNTITVANKIANVANLLNFSFGNATPPTTNGGGAGFWQTVPALIVAFGMMKVGEKVAEKRGR